MSGLIIFVFISLIGLYFFNNYWIHRFDDLIERQASVYRLDKELVWSVIYEETYFRPWKIGAAEEVGLMQVTPTVAREWAKETGFREFEEQAANNVVDFLRQPERNIQVGSWYLEKLRGNYRGFTAERAMTLAAYNAGASRVEEWTKNTDAAKLTREEFISKIDIPSTKAYVTSILTRYDVEKSRSADGSSAIRAKRMMHLCQLKAYRMTLATSLRSLADSRNALLL